MNRDELKEVFINSWKAAYTEEGTELHIFFNDVCALMVLEGPGQQYRWGWSSGALSGPYAEHGEPNFLNRQPASRSTGALISSLKDFIESHRGEQYHPIFLDMVRDKLL